MVKFRLSAKNRHREQHVADKYLTLPTGSCLKTEIGYFYINKKNNILYRYKITTDRVLNSWNFSYIVHSTEKVFGGKIKVAGTLGFRPGSLIRDISTSSIYVIDSSLKRRIEDPDYLYNLGINPNDVLLVSKEEADLHKDGEVIK